MQQKKYLSIILGLCMIIGMWTSAAYAIDVSEDTSEAGDRHYSQIYGGGTEVELKKYGTEEVVGSALSDDPSATPQVFITLYNKELVLPDSVKHDARLTFQIVKSGSENYSEIKITDLKKLMGEKAYEVFNKNLQVKNMSESVGGEYKIMSSTSGEPNNGEYRLPLDEPNTLIIAPSSGTGNESDLQFALSWKQVLKFNIEDVLLLGGDEKSKGEFYTDDVDSMELPMVLSTDPRKMIDGWSISKSSNTFDFPGEFTGDKLKKELVEHYAEKYSSSMPGILAIEFKPTVNAPRKVTLVSKDGSKSEDIGIAALDTTGKAVKVEQRSEAEAKKDIGQSQYDNLEAGLQKNQKLLFYRAGVVDNDNAAQGSKEASESLLIQLEKDKVTNLLPSDSKPEDFVKLLDKDGNEIEAVEKNKSYPIQMPKLEKSEYYYFVLVYTEKTKDAPKHDEKDVPSGEVQVGFDLNGNGAVDIWLITKDQKIAKEDYGKLVVNTSNLKKGLGYWQKREGDKKILNDIRIEKFTEDTAYILKPFTGAKGIDVDNVEGIDGNVITEEKTDANGHLQQSLVNKLDVQAKEKNLSLEGILINMKDAGKVFIPKALITSTVYDKDTAGGGDSLITTEITEEVKTINLKYIIKLKIDGKLEELTDTGIAKYEKAQVTDGKGDGTTEFKKENVALEHVLSEKEVPELTIGQGYGFVEWQAHTAGVAYSEAKTEIKDPKNKDGLKGTKIAEDEADMELIFTAVIKEKDSGNTTDEKGFKVCFKVPKDKGEFPEGFTTAEETVEEIKYLVHTIDNVQKDHVLTEAEAPTAKAKKGYEFVGWKIEEKMGSEYKTDLTDYKKSRSLKGLTIKDEQDICFIAKFTEGGDSEPPTDDDQEKKAKVTFITDKGGEFDKHDDSNKRQFTKEVKLNAKLGEDDAPKLIYNDKEYKFLGWKIIKPKDAKNRLTKLSDEDKEKKQLTGVEIKDEEVVFEAKLKLIPKEDKKDKKPPKKRPNGGLQENNDPVKSHGSPVVYSPGPAMFPNGSNLQQYAAQQGGSPVASTGESDYAPMAAIMLVLAAALLIVRRVKH